MSPDDGRGAFRPADARDALADAGSLAAESIGNTHAPSGIRYYPIAISSQVWKDQLRLNFVYSENLHTRATVEALAEAFRAKLMGLVAVATKS